MAASVVPMNAAHARAAHPHRPRAARWVGHVNGVAAPAPLQGWLCDRGSLTAKLVAHCSQFRVQRLHQQPALCLADEFAEIGLARRMRTHEREVVLRCDGRAMVFGHTVVPMSASASEWPLFAGLGERSLGSTLFSDPLVQRGALEYAHLWRSHPLMRRIYALGLAQAEQHASLFARRSVFRRKGGCLLVTEVFLPRIADFFPAAASEANDGIMGGQADEWAGDYRREKMV